MHVFQRYSDPLKSARLRQCLYEGSEGWYVSVVAGAVLGRCREAKADNRQWERVGDYRGTPRSLLDPVTGGQRRATENGGRPQGRRRDESIQRNVAGEQDCKLIAGTRVGSSESVLRK